MNWRRLRKLILTESNRVVGLAAQYNSMWDEVKKKTRVQVIAVESALATLVERIVREMQELLDLHQVAFDRFSGSSEMRRITKCCEVLSSHSGPKWKSGRNTRPMPQLVQIMRKAAA